MSGFKLMIECDDEGGVLLEINRDDDTYIEITVNGQTVWRVTQ